MTTQTTYTHVVVMFRNGRYLPIVETDSYDKALVAYEEGVKILVDKGATEGNARMALAVRSFDDPKVNWDRYAPRQDLLEPVEVTKMRNAIRAWTRKERGATATSVLKRAEDGQGFTALVKDVKTSLFNRGITSEPHEVEDALKSRVTLGRCRHGCDRAWFWRKGTGTLDEVRCPNCGSHLYQTSLAYGREFYFIAAEEPVRIPAPEPKPTYVTLDKPERELMLEIGRRAGDLYSAKDAIFNELLSDPRWEHLEAEVISDYAWAAARWCFPQESRQW